MSEMVDRVARAMWGVDNLHSSTMDYPTFAKLRPADQRVYLAMAHAAIAAMREPEEMMSMKGGNTPPSNEGRDHLQPSRRSRKRIGDLSAKECWQAMIDAALKDG